MGVENIFITKEAFLSSNDDIENIYDNESLYESVDNDMISAGEEGFMLGYLGA